VIEIFKRYAPYLWRAPCDETISSIFFERKLDKPRVYTATMIVYPKGLIEMWLSWLVEI
jgi:hypothetical protein